MYAPRSEVKTIYTELIKLFLLFALLQKDVFIHGQQTEISCKPHCLICYSLLVIRACRCSSLFENTNSPWRALELRTVCHCFVLPLI